MIGALTTRRKPALIQREWLGSDGLLLPYAALDKLVKESPVSPPSADQLYDLLTEADVLLGDDEDRVILRRDWFEEHCRVARAQQSGMLKVMG